MELVKNQRLESLDALRGFDMFFITGGGALIYLLRDKTDYQVVNNLADQFRHPPWNGFTFYDLIFPLFLFMAGVSLVYSVRSSQAKGASHIDIYKKAFIRMLLLIGLGILDKNNPLNLFDPAQIRFGSVLGRIGIAAFLSTYIYLNFKSKQLYWIVGVLLAYYATLFLIPVPGFGRGDLSFEGNLVGYIDRTFMPGRLLQGTYDELALLTQFPALCLTLAGTLAADVLRSTKGEIEKLKCLVFFGVVGTIIGLIWSLHFPINKHLWSSSFISLTAGLSFLLLTLFYWLIDVKKYRKWAFFFKVIGVNSLFIYLAVALVNFNYTSERLFKGFYMHAPEKWHSFFVALGSLVVVWLIMHFLYKKKIYIRI